MFQRIAGPSVSAFKLPILTPEEIDRLVAIIPAD